MPSDGSNAGAGMSVVCILYSTYSVWLGTVGWMVWRDTARYVCHLGMCEMCNGNPMIRVRPIVSARTREYIKIKREHEIIVMSTRSLCCQIEIINGKMSTTHTHMAMAAKKGQRQTKQIKTGRTTSSFNTWNASQDYYTRMVRSANEVCVYVERKPHSANKKRHRRRAERSIWFISLVTFNLICRSARYFVGKCVTNSICKSLPIFSLGCNRTLSVLLKFKLNATTLSSRTRLCHVVLIIFSSFFCWIRFVRKSKMTKLRFKCWEDGNGWDKDPTR